MNRPELTDEKFVPNPFADDPGAPSRLYKTGDLVRFTAGGALEFLGRIDAQVKIRGFRVELAEIESQLRQCPGVQSAIVALREDTPGIQQLVAYVIPLREAAFDSSTAREQLRYRLPAYMVPSAFVIVDEFPAMPSGKVDRRRLPAPGAVVCGGEGVPEGSCTVMEGRVLEVWRRLFATPHISPDDDFFELGGHSLLAARMVSELRKDPSMGTATVLDVYNHPTLAAFASKLEERGREDAAQAADETAASGSAAAEPHRASRLSYYLCALAQVVGLYAVYGLMGLGLIVAYLQFVAVYERTGDLLLAALSLALLPILLTPTGLAIIFASKWILIGRYREGVWPVWSFYYWRFWLAARIQALMPLNYFRGTPLLVIYARLMGARIGAHVHLGTRYLHCYDLLTVGDDSSVGLDAHLTGYEVEGGLLRVGPVSIGDRCEIGARAVLGLGSVVEDDATVDELSSLQAGMVVKSHERWVGSPAQPLPHENGNGKHVDPYRPGRARTVAYGLLYWLSTTVLLPAVTVLGSLPSLAIFLHVALSRGIVPALLWSPVLAAISTIVFCLEIALVKWALLGRIKPGRYTLHSGIYFRKWFVDCLMQMSLEMLHPLYATIYLPPWFRMLGAKLGRRVEISTASHVSADLLSLGDESFIADSACLGAPKVRLGYLTVAATTVGSRTFIGNSAVIPAGARIGDSSLIGVMSTPPSRKTLAEHPHSSWLGSPPVLLPRRQPSASFPDRLTFNPSWQLYLLRGFIEFWRVTLPATLLVLMGSSMIYATYVLDRTLGPLQLLALFPFVYFAAAWATTLVVVALKWLIIGRYKPCTKPLWSSFVWRNELITAMHESFCAPALLNALEGTPFLAPYFRLMGSRIGGRVYMETTQITEFDLVDVGSDVSLNLTCTLQSHLFEDRVMKASTSRLGDGCTLGPWAVVLYDTEMADGSSLGALSLLMKGEALPARTGWQGIPARRARAGRAEAAAEAVLSSSFVAEAASASSPVPVAELA
jgi:non-ribosomal peptide synthetase-like protein